MGHNSNSSAQSQLKLLHPLVDAIVSAKGKCYLVGGAVRDKFLNRVPNDYDLIVTGIPSGRLHDLLIPFGVTVPHKFIDGAYKLYGILGTPVDISISRDVRNGEKYFSDIFPIESYLKDVDFTINAMAVDMETNELIDPYNGVSDCFEKVIRILPAHTSILYNKMVPLRAARLRAMLGFSVDPHSIDIMISSMDMLFQVNPDRRVLELYKMFQYPEYKLGIDLLIKLNIFGKLYIEYDALYRNLIAQIDKVS